MDAEIIDLDNLDNLEQTGNSSSVNFGGGIELLMNDKKKNSGGSDKNVDIGLDDITNLENELNDLADVNTKPGVLPNIDNISVSVNDDLGNDNLNTGDSKLGAAVLENKANADSNKTWDGFDKFNNIPMNPNVKREEPQKSKEEILREKFDMLRKLEALEKKGITLSKHYTMESSLNEMQGEYESIKSEAEKKNSIKFQGKMLMAAITGLEFLNNKFDPFDLRLDGWAEQISENVDDYDEIFGELHEKYKSKATMAPELKLLFQLGGSACMLHMTNSMFKNSIPGMDDIMKQNPELMQQFTQAAVNQMENTSPGFGGFMNTLNEERRGGGGGARPPSPVETKKFNIGRDSAATPFSNNNKTGKNMSTNSLDNTNRIEEIVLEDEKPQKSSRLRPDMKGPSDITDLLSNLKSTTNNKTSSGLTVDDTSTVSISELKEMQKKAKDHKKVKKEQKVTKIQLA